jgi:hypothetical protein
VVPPASPDATTPVTVLQEDGSRIPADQLPHPDPKLKGKWRKPSCPDITNTPEGQKILAEQITKS